MLQEEWELMWMTMGKGKLIDEILALNAKVFQPTLLIIQRKCHPCVKSTETILN
jgi:hypothetical protein